MRNLKLLSVVNFPNVTSLKGCTFLSIDYDTNFVYGATPSGSVVLFDPNHKEILAESSVCDEPESRVVGVHHLPDHMALCLAISSGDILLWNANLKNVECVGTVDGGINGMSWSPDMELVALTTGLNKLILMTRDFDPVMETCLTEEGFGEAQPVTVGWGKKETQFHGSEGKKAAVKTDKELNPALDWDDHQPRISWREDGQFFAVTLVHAITGARQIRVWTRAGVLHSTSEDVNGLGQSISYKPSGSLIASSAPSHDKHLIVFFEKNGLRHGEFSLPFNASDVKVLELRWNLDSTVLAVWCEDLLKDDLIRPKSYLQLWTCGNYHWYLKQSLEFSATADERMACFTWDTEAAYRLHIVLGNGQYQQYTWSWLTNHSSSGNVNDLASVAVIDGERVLVTPFRLMVIPPPLCAYHLRLPTAVSQVTFGTGLQTNDIIVLTSDNQLMLFAHMDDKVEGVGGVLGLVECQAAGGNGFSSRCPLPQLRATVSFGQLLDNTAFTSTLTHLTCVADDSSFVFCLTESLLSVFMHITVDWTLGKISVVSRVAIEASVMAISVSSKSGTVAVQMVDGAIFRYDTALGVLTPWTNQENLEVKFPYACPQMAVGTIGGQEVVLGLTERFRFFVNNIELASDCSSFALHDEFLLLTTHAHTVRCICRKTPIEALSAIQASKAHVFDETIRRIERGSRIVSAVSEDTKLILQMPRGNLELIHPRALILSVIRKNLDRLDFGEAFNLAKKHRISMNLLYDHKPSAFTANVEAFVTQLKSAGNINLFLTDLIEEDVTVTMYTFAYGDQPSAADSSVSSEQRASKLDTVSSIVCAALEKIDEEKYFLSILTTFVKRSTPDLESALKKIKSIKEKSSTSISYGEALEYLLYLVDVNKLYEVALGMYDFDLVLMVAEKSQKDPKEYLAHLKGLQEMEPNYRCYSIDLQLKRFSKALTHISKCGEEHFEECLKLVIEHSLYSEALALFPAQSTEYKKVSTAFGKHLSKMKKFQEAGIVFCWAGDNAQALEMFEVCRDWRSAMCMASQLNYSAKELNDLSRRMARKLKDNHRHDEAAILLEQYADDYEEAIVTLIAGNEWTEALRLIYKYKRSDFIETDFKPALLEVHSQLRAWIETKRSEFSRHFERLKAVRKIKLSKLETVDFADGMNHPNGDLYSDTSSVTGDSVVSGRSSQAGSQKSGYSRTSGRTAKSRQKQEKKKWSLREGSPYEEEALVEVLHKIASQAEDEKEDVSDLLRMLTLFQRKNEAAELQTDFEQLLQFIEKCVPDIWTLDLTNGACTQKPVFGPNSTVNSITQDLTDRKSQPTVALRLGPELLRPPTFDKSIDWKMTILNRSS